MHFATMSEWLTPAKISFACSAHYFDQMDVVNLTTEQQALLKEISDSNFKESVRDFMVNQQFRKDYWIKGPRKLSSQEQVERITGHEAVMTSHRDDITLKIIGTAGEVTLNEAIYAPLLDLMSDYKVRSIRDISEKLKQNGISLSQIVQAVMLLIGSGHMESAQSEASIKNSITTSKKLNDALINIARINVEASNLASPVTGGGIAVNRFQQLFILAINQGQKQPEELAKSAWTMLASQNQRLLKDGKAIETAEANLAELTRQAQDFSNKKLPILKALQVV